MIGLPRWRTRRPVEVVGADLLDGLEQPCVFWALDATAEAVRTGLRSAGWRRPVRVIAPAVGQLAQRRGPSVALLVDDAVVAADHLAQLLPVTVVPLWFGGADGGAEGPIRMRIGNALVPTAGEDVTRFTDRVADAAETLASEEAAGWWQVMGAGTVTAAPPVTPGGWRQRWQRTESLPARPRIWGA